MNNVRKCALLLSNENDCRNAMMRVVDEYPISSRQHLSKSSGRKPWLGQAACNIQLGATEEETRIAWNFYMSDENKNMANKIAEHVIEEWENENA